MLINLHTLILSFLSDPQLSVLEADGEFRAFCWAAGRDKPRDGKPGELSGGEVGFWYVSSTTSCLSD